MWTASNTVVDEDLLDEIKRFLRIKRAKEQVLEADGGSSSQQADAIILDD
jgi:hypothetical protein